MFQRGNYQLQRTTWCNWLRSTRTSSGCEWRTRRHRAFWASQRRLQERRRRSGSRSSAAASATLPQPDSQTPAPLSTTTRASKTVSTTTSKVRAEVDSLVSIFPLTQCNMEQCETHHYDVLTASAIGNETKTSASGHYHAVTPTSSASTRAGRKSNRSNLEKDKGKSKRHAGRQQRRDVMTIFPTPFLNMAKLALIS